MDGDTWPSVDHYFYAMHFDDAALRSKIQRARTSNIARQIARDPANAAKIRPNWNSVQLQVMRQALEAKFTQHEELLDELCDTDHIMLVAFMPHDLFWGRTRDGRGDNHLGVLLMQLRQTLRQQHQDACETAEQDWRLRVNRQYTKWASDGGVLDVHVCDKHDNIFDANCMTCKYVTVSFTYDLRRYHALLTKGIAPHRCALWQTQYCDGACYNCRDRTLSWHRKVVVDDADLNSETFERTNRCKTWHCHDTTNTRT